MAEVVSSHMKQVHHNGHVHSHVRAPPETVIDELGSPKRNVLRKRSKYQRALRKAHTSGKSLDEFINDDFSSLPIDERDPNFDRESDLTGSEIEEVIDVSNAKSTLPKYKKMIEPLILAFFLNGDFDDLIDVVQSTGCPEYGYVRLPSCFHFSSITSLFIGVS